MVTSVTAYEGNDPYIFISYAHKNSATVLPLIAGLQEQGFRVWYDAGIQAGTEWPEYIAGRLVGSHCVVAFISNEALNSQNCRREINFAIAQRKDPIAIYLDDVQMTYGMQMQLGSLQAMFYDRHPDAEAFLDSLCAAELLQPCRTAAVSQRPSVPAPAPWERCQAPVQLPDTGGEDPAVAHLRQLAEAGDMETLHSLGIHPEAEGVDLYFRKLAPGSEANPQFDLGTQYDLGIYVKQDKAAAVKWYREAAAQGHAGAMRNLGYCYDQGEGVPQDSQQALSWFSRAAELGDANAMTALGDLCCTAGAYRRALDWYQKAQEAGDRRVGPRILACREKLTH